jgi:protein-disulfide isomerase
MHEKLLAESPKLDRDSLIQYARELGLDMKKFIKALDTKKHDALINRDLKLAEDLDLYNTPTFFFNGREVIGNRPYENLKEILLEELNAAGK